jgi:hypothetical protein
MPENSAQVSRSADFQIVYDGPALESGAMDVRDLAPALLALSSLIDLINLRVNGSDRPVNMQFKSTSQGSLVAHLQLASTWFQDVASLFTSVEGQNLKLIMDTLWGGGLLGGGIYAVKGIFHVIRFLKGSPPTRVEQGPGNTIVIYNITNNNITTNLGTLELAQDARIKLEAAKVVRPLEKEGVDSFVVSRGEERSEEPIVKEDLPAFSPEHALLTIPEDVSVVLLQLVQADVTGSNAKWRFTDGNGRFDAVITDEAFMTRFRDREFTVGHNDALRVELVRRQSISEAGKIKTDNEIRRVLNYYGGGVPPAQGALPL